MADAEADTASDMAVLNDLDVGGNEIDFDDGGEEGHDGGGGIALGLRRGSDDGDGGDELGHPEEVVDLAAMDDEQRIETIHTLLRNAHREEASSSMMHFLSELSSSGDHRDIESLFMGTLERLGMCVVHDPYSGALRVVEAGGVPRHAEGRAHAFDAPRRHGGGRGRGGGAGGGAGGRGGGRAIGSRSGGPVVAAPAAAAGPDAGAVVQRRRGANEVTLTAANLEAEMPNVVVSSVGSLTTLWRVNVVTGVRMDRFVAALCAACRVSWRRVAAVTIACRCAVSHAGLAVPASGFFSLMKTQALQCRRHAPRRRWSRTRTCSACLSRATATCARCVVPRPSRSRRWTAGASSLLF